MVGWLLAGRILVCLLTFAAAGCVELRAWGPSPRGTPPDPPARPPARSNPEAPRPDTPPAEPERPRLTAEDTAEVERLLVRADRAIDEDHLTYPSQGSALALYDRVVILDPGNDEARRGLERIVERYLEMALSASAQRRFSYADAMLDRARLVDPDHPGIAPTEAQLRMLTDAERRVVRLDGQRLRDQDPAVKQTLREAGLASRGDGCRAQITARSDSEGRWIYQQMSEAPGDGRIRAQLDIGSSPRIEVLCFPDSP
jgi:hypothetical protein